MLTQNSIYLVHLEEIEKFMHQATEVEIEASKNYLMNRIKFNMDKIKETPDEKYLPRYNQLVQSLIERTRDNLPLELQKADEELFQEGLKELYHFMHVLKVKDIKGNEALTQKVLSLLIPTKNNPDNQYTGLDVYKKLQDEESRTIYKEFFYQHYVTDNKYNHGERYHYSNIINTTLISRLNEKGKDLRAYPRINKLFFLGIQYFDLPDLKFSDNEVFIDAGAADASTITPFLCFCNNKYHHIYAFEPNQDSYQRMCNKINEWGIKNITTIPKGLYDKNTSLFFSGESTGFRVNAKGTVEIPVITLDSYLQQNQRVTFIKMDIEGSELAALRGCKETILFNKPKLAICIYHKPKEDMIDIPTYLLSLVPEYRFYVRHYSYSRLDTILYALV